MLGKEIETQTREASDLDSPTLREKADISNLTKHGGRTTINSNISQTKEQSNEAKLTEISAPFIQEGIHDLYLEEGE